MHNLAACLTFGFVAGVVYNVVDYLERSRGSFWTALLVRLTAIAFVMECSFIVSSVSDGRGSIIFILTMFSAGLVTSNFLTLRQRRLVMARISGLLSELDYMKDHYATSSANDHRHYEDGATEQCPDSCN